MDPERPGSAPQPCTLQPSSEPGFVPLPFFLRHDSPMSWDLCAPIPAAESLDSWESSLLWDGGSLVIANSSQGQPGTPGGAGSISPQPPLDLSGFPLAEPWDVLSPDAPADAAPDFVHPLVTAVHLDPGAPWLMSRINPAGSTPTPPPLDPAGFPLPELWTGPHMDAPPDAASDPALPPVAAACLDPADVPPTSITNPDLGEVLAHVSHTLRCHPKGMRVKPLTKRLRKEHGVDLLAFSQDGGYQGVVSFLQEMPGIELWNPEKGEKCRVLSCTFKKNVTDPLPLLCSTLGSFPNGLRVFSLRKAMWQRHGVNLEEFSQQQGYLSTLDYLTRLRGIRLQGLERGEKCLVQLQKGDAVKPPAPQPPPDPAPPSAQPSSSPPPDAPADGGPTGAPGETPGLAEVSAWVRDVLGRFPLGLKVGKLKEALRSERGLDLEELSRQRGCGDALHLLRALPHLWLQDPGKGDACLARLDADAAINAPALPAPSHPAKAGGPGAAGPAKRTQGQRRVAKPGAMEALIRSALAPYPFGMRVKNLRKLLVGKHGAELEAFSQARGYGDVVSFLRDVPGLTLRGPEKGNNCIVWLQRGATEVLTLLKCLLRPYKSGLQLQKLQELLLERHGLDLKRFVSSQGEEDVLGFLQRRLPALEYRQPEKGAKCIVWLGTGQKKGSGSLPPGSARPLPGSKRCLLPTNAAERPPQPATACLNPRLPSATTNRPLLPSLPSAREPFRAPAAQGKLGKSPGANPRLPAWLLSPPRPTGTCSGLRTEEGTHESGTRPASAPLVLRAEEGTQEFGTRPASAPLVLQAEEGTQESRAQPPEDLRELKRKVGAILAGHPGGMSLFQFRAAYSAAHQHPLPLGCTASTKQRLAQMPDVVRMQGCGVQMLLLPVDPDEPPGAEPGLALWIPQEAAALAGDTDDPSEPLPTLAEIPPVLTAPDPAGDPDTPSEPPSFPAAPDLSGDPDTPAESPPTLPEIPPVLTAPDPAGDPKVPVKPPPTLVAPRWGPSLQAMQRPEAARPEPSWELPDLVPSAPVVLPASGPGSRSWLWLGAESPPAPADPGAAARPVVYPPPREVPPAPAAAPESPSLCPAAPGPPQARLKRVQLVPPFQDHPWAGDASRAQPVPKAVAQNQGTSAAVGSPVGPIPADPSTGQAVSPIKQLSGVVPDPLPPPEASVSATPERGWPDTGHPGSGGDIGSPVDPLLRCHPAQPVPSAGTTQPGPWAGIPSAPPAHSPPHHTDTCVLL